MKYSSLALSSCFRTDLLKFATAITSLVLLVLFSTQASAFNYLRANGAKHDNTQPIPYFINLGAYSDAANRDQMIQGIQNAFQLVEDHPLIAVDFEYLGETTALPSRDNVNVVYIDSGREYVPGAGIAFNYNVSGSTILSADIGLNGDTHGNSPLVKLYALALHELLHFLGLDHSSTGRDSAVFGGTINLDLAADDIAGLATLYPTSSNPLANSTASISGQVTDTNGQPLNARVVAYDPSQNQPRIVTANTQDDGTYTLVGLPEGNYRIVAESRGNSFVHEYLNEGAIYSATAGANFANQNLAITSYGHPRLSTTAMHKPVQHPLSATIYATKEPNGPIFVIDPVSGSIRKRINIAANDIELSADGTELYAVNQIGRSLHVVDLDPNSANFESEVATLTDLPSQPLHLVVTSANVAYIATHGGRSVVAMDMNTRTELATINTGLILGNITLSANERIAYVDAIHGGRPNGAHWVLEVDIDPNSPSYHTILSENPVGSNDVFYALADDSDTYVFQGTRSGIDIRNRSDYSLVTSVDSGRFVLNILKSPDGSRISFLSQDSSELQNTELWTINALTHEITGITRLGGNYEYLAQGNSANEVIVSGRSGMALVSVSDNTPSLYAYCSDNTLLSMSIDPHLAAINSGDTVSYQANVAYNAPSICPPLFVNTTVNDSGSGFFDGADGVGDYVEPNTTKAFELTLQHNTYGIHNLNFSAVSAILPLNKIARVNTTVAVVCPMNLTLNPTGTITTAVGNSLNASVSVQSDSQSCSTETVQIELMLNNDPSSLQVQTLTVTPGISESINVNVPVNLAGADQLTARLIRLGIETDRQTRSVFISPTTITVDDFSQGLGNWNSQNGQPGDRGSHWKGWDNVARYSFFYEHINGWSEGTRSSTRTLSRQIQVPTTTTGNLQLRWDWNYAYHVDNMTLTGRIQGYLQPDSACSNQTLLNLGTLTLVDGVYVDTVNANVDVSAYAGCNVNLVFNARNQASPIISSQDREMGGHFSIDNIEFVDLPANAPFSTLTSIDDFAQGIDAWSYINGQPGDRGSKWVNWGNTATYYFFYENPQNDLGDGASNASQSLSRTVSLPELGDDPLLIHWDWSYLYSTLDVNLTGRIDLTLSPAGNCSTSIKRKLGTLTLSDDQTTSEISEATDISQYAGCDVNLVFSASNSGSGTANGDREFYGRFEIDNIFLTH
ncbi:MAG: carboxypeptidase regulatory-like domain-containing protein [Cellvibrionaceae bacterium]